MMRTRNTALRVLFWVVSGCVLSTAAYSQPTQISPERRATNSPVTVPADAADEVPQFMVDPFWPKPLPNNWILGQVSGVHVDSNDHVRSCSDLASASIDSTASRRTKSPMR